MKLDPTLLKVLSEDGPFDASACLNCGSCTALCPLGIELFPRHLFRLALLGARERLVERTEVVYSCLLCKFCEENCPAGVHITDNVRALRTYLGREVFHLPAAEA